jgi:DNA-binding MarR family transcriptional regulator
MTNRIDRLEEQGLVARTPCRRDRRSILVALTTKGKKTIDTAVTEHTVKEHGRLAPLTPKEQRQLADLLRKLLVQFNSSVVQDRI